MTAMDAQTADKTAADEAFRLRIDDFALADAKGLAPAAISAQLRSPKWCREWNSALGRMAGTEAITKGSKEFRHRVHQLRLEACQAARKEHAIMQADNVSVFQIVKELVDVEIRPNASLHEMSVILLAEILAEMRSWPA